MRNALELSIAKTNEQDILIEELSNTLLIAKNEIEEVKKDPEGLRARLKELKDKLEDKDCKNEEVFRKYNKLKKKEVNNLEEIQAKEREISYCKRENYQLKLKIEEYEEIVNFYFNFPRFQELRKNLRILNQTILTSTKNLLKKTKKFLMKTP